MNKVLLFGGTGNLGKEIAKEVRRIGYHLTALVRNSQKANELAGLADQIVIANVTEAGALKNICNGFDIVISSLGKSVSPAEKSKQTFYDVDFVANATILEEALKSGVQKFVYVSAIHSERFTHLEYFKVHHAFSEKLMTSGLDYSIIKPPAIFSAFLEITDMAKKGRLVHFGPGNHRTNPIYEGDLAQICVEAIKTPRCVVEAGGKEILTRRQINEAIQNQADPTKKIRTVSPVVMKLLLPIIRLFDRNQYDKFSFFMEVMQHDMIAPRLGDMTFQEYLRMKS